MNKTNRRYSLLWFFFAVTTALMSNGCGGGGADGVPLASPGSPSVVSSTVSGVAATGAPIQGKAYLRDSGTAAERSAAIGSDGYFAFDVEGLKAPFLLRAEWMTDSGKRELYSFAAGPGTANINPLSNAAVVSAAGGIDDSFLSDGLNSIQMEQTASALPGIVVALQEELKPLLDYFNAISDPIIGLYSADHTGLDAMFDAVSIDVSGGKIVLTNRATGAQIFTCATTDISGGRFNTQNVPGAMPAPTPNPIPP
ncbi:hypothetical protein EG829_06415, partial [bacterium]|nr:hypothetical protein [bacterium]